MLSQGLMIIISRLFVFLQQCKIFHDLLIVFKFQICPRSYSFSDCMATTGTENCGFVESPQDDLDWVIATGNVFFTT